MSTGFSSVEEPSEEAVLQTAFGDFLTTQDRIRVSKLRAISLSLFVICFNAVGNLSLAWGMKHLPAVGLNPLGYVQAMVNPYVAGGIGLLILWLLTRMALMSWADLTFVLPFMSVGYVVAAALGKFVLNEPVGWGKWVGIFLIFAGSLVVGTTDHQSNRPGNSDDCRAARL